MGPWELGEVHGIFGEEKKVAWSLVYAGNLVKKPRAGLGLCKMLLEVGKVRFPHATSSPRLL